MCKIVTYYERFIEGVWRVHAGCMEGACGVCGCYNISPTFACLTFFSASMEMMGC
jgi:hypothetical protein